FRVSRDGTPNFLEINPLPGLNSKTSDLVILSGKVGWTYEALISAVLASAIERYPHVSEKSRHHL
ncbi:MAG: D-alanine--D-alanine ligase, partial [Dehalococcoidales bacterium]|nr:D-alanine--D-alanine ligase [Dehalococcoidales bacterium]